MDNKFPGKDISEEDIKSKFPLAAKKSMITSLNLQLQVLNLVEIYYQSLQDLIWLKVKI